MPAETTKESFKLRRSDIIQIIVAFCYIAVAVYYIGITKSQIDTNTAWIKKHLEISADIREIKNWMVENKRLPKEVLEMKVDFKYLAQGIETLTCEVKSLNKNFTRLNQRVANNDYRP